MYTLTDRLLVVSISVLFIMVVIICVFSANIAAMWLENKREERKRIKNEYMTRTQKRADADREQWMGWLEEKDKKYEAKEKEYTKLKLEYEESQRRLARVIDLLDASERERQKLMKGE